MNYWCREHEVPKRPKPDEMRRIFGLEDPFWDPGSDQFD